MSAFPLPTARGRVVVPAPGTGPGCWAGAPSAALDADGTVVVAYRLRNVEERGASVVVARAEDPLETVVTLDKDRFGAMSLERPALVRTEEGRWRIYVSCATPGSKHWWIDVLEADTLEGLADADARTVFPGDDATGVKDPVVCRTDGGWEAWICCHPLDVPGEEDRMTTAYAVSPDGLMWQWRGTVLAGRAGRWDARGGRVTAVVGGELSYDGRATEEENFFERTGLAGARDAPVSHVRYLDVLPLPGGGYRLHYEAPLPDASHELWTDLVR